MSVQGRLAKSLVPGAADGVPAPANETLRRAGWVTVSEGKSTVRSWLVLHLRRMLALICSGDTDTMRDDVTKASHCAGTTAPMAVPPALSPRPAAVALRVQAAAVPSAARAARPAISFMRVLFIVVSP